MYVQLKTSCFRPSNPIPGPVNCKSTFQNMYSIKQTLLNALAIRSTFTSPMFRNLDGMRRHTSVIVVLCKGFEPSNLLKKGWNIWLKLFETNQSKQHHRVGKRIWLSYRDWEYSTSLTEIPALVIDEESLCATSMKRFVSLRQCNYDLVRC